MNAHDKAFPGRDDTGMSLRDYFAAAALPAVIMRSSVQAMRERKEDIAGIAYVYADAMLKVREP